MKLNDESYETGYCEGGSSVVADIALQFSEAASMDELLEFFRTMTGNLGLEWPGILSAPARQAVGPHLSGTGALSWPTPDQGKTGKADE